MHTFLAQSACNSRVVQAACKVILHVLPVLQDPRWDLKELALLLDAFCPLYRAETEQEDDEHWETLLPPGDLTGIRTEVFRSLRPETASGQTQARASRRTLQRAIFRSSDVSEWLPHVRSS